MKDFRPSVVCTAAVAVMMLLVAFPTRVEAGGGMNCGFGDFEGADETIRLFPTYAVVSPDGETLILPLRVWVYEREQDRLRRFAVEQIAGNLGIEEDSPEYPIFKRRMFDFMVDNESGEQVFARVYGDGVESKVERDLGETSGAGHLSAKLEIPYDPPDDPDKRTVRLQIRLEDSPFSKRIVDVPVVPRKGLTVISDIDDTIKITNVIDKKELVANTFTREFRAIPGMAKRYSAWAKEGATFHYVSASPWVLYPELTKFAKKSGFPSGVYHLRVLRLKDIRGTYAFLQDSRAHKVKSIRTLLKRFPARKFILVGDTGEKDPEVYGEIARSFPKKIKHVYLRRVEGAENDSARFSSALDGVPKDRWTLFSDPKKP